MSTLRMIAVFTQEERASRVRNSPFANWNSGVWAASFGVDARYLAKAWTGQMDDPTCGMTIVAPWKKGSVFDALRLRR